MNSRIVPTVGLAVVFAAILIPISSPTPAYAAEVQASIVPNATNLGDKSYQPNPIEINVGDTVRWTNNDGLTQHTVTSGTPGAGPDGKFGGTADNPFSDPIAGGETFSYTFNEEGEFPYYCTLHSGMVGTVMVASANGNGNGTTTPFIVTATADGTDYEITGTSETAQATAATINPGQSVEIQFNGPGTVELTLPTIMIDDISTVMAGSQQITTTTVDATDQATTISFEIPEGQTTVQIIGGFVVPEFPVIAAILAATIAAIIGYTRSAKVGSGFLGKT